MPIKDPEKKRAATKAWRERVMPQGYGKWLYARRKLRFEDAEIFRGVLEDIANRNVTAKDPAGLVGRYEEMARRTLDESQQREDELGPWVPPD